jgi:hypothetical protein
MTIASRFRQRPRRALRHGAAALTAAVLVLGGMVGCNEPTIPFPNGPTEDEVKVITSRDQIQGLATGLLDGDRASHVGQIVFFESMGRDMYRIDPAESRFLSNLLGPRIDPSNFIGSGLWTAPYRAIRTANMLISATDASTAAVPTPLTDAEKASTKGFARTVEAMQYLRLIETRDDLGIPIEVKPDQNVPIRCKPAVLDYIAALLDSAATDLEAGGATFTFAFPEGFRGFDTPATFLKFNRALKAKVDYYRGFLPLQADPAASPNTARLQAALDALNSSFYTPSGLRADLDLGVYHVYSTASGETINGLYDVGAIRINPKVIHGDVVGGDTPEPGDQRIRAKMDTLADAPLTLRSVTSSIVPTFPSSPKSPLAYLRNEELILMRGQILWGMGKNDEAISMLNFARQGAGLPALTAADLDTKEKVIKQLLKEKRYSLLLESPARLIDHRLLHRVDALGLEHVRAVGSTAGDYPAQVRLPIPSNESVARSGDIACKP